MIFFFCRSPSNPRLGQGWWGALRRLRGLIPVTGFKNSPMVRSRGKAWPARSLSSIPQASGLPAWHVALPPGATPGSCRRAGGRLCHTTGRGSRRNRGTGEIRDAWWVCLPLPGSDCRSSAQGRAETGTGQGAHGVLGCPGWRSLPGLCRTSVQRHPSLLAPSPALPLWGLQALGDSWALGCPDCPLHGSRAAVGCCSIPRGSQPPETAPALLYWERQRELWPDPWVLPGPEAPMHPVASGLSASNASSRSTGLVAP